jgi:hypothetical protein
VDDREDRTAPSLRCQASVVGLRAGAPARGEFCRHALDVTYRKERLARHGLADPARLDSIRQGEALDDVKERLGAVLGLLLLTGLVLWIGSRAVRRMEIAYGAET